MAGKNYINLLQELKKLKNFELIVFMTYSFDPIFFDNVILRELKINNPKAIILIFIDSTHYTGYVEKGTDATGVEYALIPVNGGIFHPKLFLFYSSKNAVVYIGSHNLTLTGITHNFELSCKTTDRQIVSECLKYTRTLLRQTLGKDNYLLEEIESIAPIETHYQTDRTIHFLHNLDSPILKKTLDILKGKQAQIREIIIIAPFFSDERNLLNLIHSKTKAKKVKICIQRYNHNLNPHQIISLPFVQVEEVMPKEKRRIHSKLIIFKAKNKDFILMGSPNFTATALSKVAGHGNFETALLIEVSNSYDLLSELNFKEISFKEIVKTRCLEDRTITIIREKPEIQIRMGYTDLLSQIVLDINTDQKLKGITLNLKLDGARLESIPVDIDGSGIYTIPYKIERGMTAFIWFSHNGKLISNKIRVYNPRERISYKKYSGDLTKIANFIVDSKNLDELLQIIATLFPEERDFPKTSSKSVVSGPSPGKIATHHVTNDILGILEGLLRVPQSSILGLKKRKRVRICSLPTKKEKPPRRFEERIAKIMEKFKRAFGARKLAKDNTPIMYSIFLLINLKLLDLLRMIHNQKYFLTCIMRNLLELLNSYGISKEKDSKSLSQLLSLLVYIQNEMEKQNCDLTIMKKIIGEMSEQFEPLLFSFEEPLKGHKFIDQISMNLKSLKFQVSKEDENNYYKIIGWIVSEIIMRKDQGVQEKYVRRTIAQIFSDGITDLERLFLFRTLNFITHRHAIKNIVYLKMKEIKDEKLKGFRKTLYNDIYRLIGS